MRVLHLSYFDEKRLLTMNPLLNPHKVGFLFQTHRTILDQSTQHTTSRSIFGHIWPSGGLMRTIGENIDKTAFTQVLALVKKKDSIFLKIFFENEFLKDIYMH